MAGGAGGEGGVGAGEFGGALVHEPGQIALEREQFLLGALALGDVAEMGGKNRRTVGGDARDGQLDGKLRPVGAHGGDLDALTEHLGRAAAEHPGHAGAMAFAHGGRDDEVAHLTTDHLGPCVAEGAFGRRIEIDETPLVVDGDDAIQRDLEDAGEVRLKARLGGGEGIVGGHRGSGRQQENDARRRAQSCAGRRET
jgi:hypothetical protein